MSGLALYPIVLLHDLNQFIVRQCLDGPVAPRYGLGCDHRVDDRFLRGVGRGREERIEIVIRKILYIRDGFLRDACAGCGERQENITAAVAAQRACACHAEGGAFGESLELMGEQRRVGGEDDDQRTVLLDEKDSRRC